MAKNQEIFFTKEGHVAELTGVNVVAATLLTAGADGAKVLSIRVNANAALDDLLIFVDEGGGNKKLATIVAPAVGTQVLLGLLPKDKNGNEYMNIPGAAKVQLATDAGNMDVSAYYEDF